MRPRRGEGSGPPSALGVKVTANRKSPRKGLRWVPLFVVWNREAETPHVHQQRAG